MTGGWLPEPRPAADDSADLMRLARYRREHPHVTVQQGPGYWQAIIPEGSGESVRTAYELDELLDKLEPPDTG